MANQGLIKKIKVAHSGNGGTNGSPRGYQELKGQGVTCSENLVARLMRLRRIRAKQTRCYKVTTKRNKAHPVARIDRARMPDAIISFESMDHRILARNTFHRSAQGLLDEIAMNTKHLDRPMWAILKTLLHEQIHLWQRNLGEHQVERNYHNKEFVNKCEQLGLYPRSDSGVHWKPADGVFAQPMEEYGIPPPA